MSKITNDGLARTAW